MIHQMSLLLQAIDQISGGFRIVFDNQQLHGRRGLAALEPAIAGLGFGRGSHDGHSNSPPGRCPAPQAELTKR